MSAENTIKQRSESSCEFCKSTDDIQIYTLSPHQEITEDHSVLLCGTCFSAVDDAPAVDVNHWRCLNESMWSPYQPVQVLAWRVLNQIKDEGWPQDLLDMLVLEDDALAWAKSGANSSGYDGAHKDSNGAVLESGDSVVLIKDLPVKGANFTAKRGTAVRNISLVADNPEHIEGKVNGQRIVILTKFVKKSK